MITTTRKLSSQLLVLPNSTYFFGTNKHLQSNALQIVHETTISNTATVYFLSAGAIGFDFLPSGHLGSIDVLEWHRSGEIPADVMENHDHVVALQLSRIEFSNFISAAFFGRMSALNNRPLTGASFARLDEIISFQKQGNSLILLQDESKKFVSRIHEKANALSHRQNATAFIAIAEIETTAAYIQHLIERSAQFEYASLQSAMTMNYQAAILHNHQHTAASFALNFSVIECLVKELFYAYGLLVGHTSKSFTSISYKDRKISEKRFDQMNLAKKLDHLKECSLMDPYLYDRIKKARRVRNDLMHSGKPVVPKQSGECETIVRDLWALLIDKPFELNAGWTYRY